MKGIDLGFRQRRLSHSKLDRDVIKAARAKAAIEMAQAWNDNTDGRNLNVGAGLVEDEEVVPVTFHELHAGEDLLAPVECYKFRKLAAGRSLAMR